MTEARSQPDSRPAHITVVENRAGPRPAQAPPRYPILIGISGKRFFDKNDPEADARVAQALADRFRSVFAALDQDLPHTPKVLLTGAAAGADLIAAEAALEMGPHWAVAAILPFDRALFEDDFRPPPDEPQWRDQYAAYAAAFERVLGAADKPNPRVLVRELPKLLFEHGGAATADQLSRQAAQPDKTLRRNHYEQVGQFIAEIATIMIAVMSADEQPETSEANGGTARIVAYRRAGRPDPLGAAVARRSRVLRHEWSEVMEPPGGYVWLMDPRKLDVTGRYSVKVLPPLLDRSVHCVYGGHPGADMTPEHESYRGPLRRLAGALRVGGSDSRSGAELRRLRASLVLARGFDRFHREGTPATDQVAAAESVELSPVMNVPEALNSARSRISARQREVNSQVRGDFVWLAVLFVTAVIILEIYAKLLHDSVWLLSLYLLILAVIGARAFRARWQLREAIAEDYRAVAEILRVQSAWWWAGLDDRVDREHLQGVDQDLAPIRDCAKTIIGWILLRHGWPDDARARDWARVRGTSDKARDLRGGKPPGDWVGSQLWYFVNNGEDRETRVHVVDALSWSLFVVSGVLAAVLWTWIAFPQAMTMFMHAAHIRLPSWASFIGFDISPLLWILLAALIIGFRVWNHDVRQGLGAIFLAGAAGILAAVALALALVDAGPLVARVSDIRNDELAAIYAVIITLVVLSAAAGALRYLIERLNVEAEALEYRDARGRFERAERRLAGGADPATGTPANEEAAKRVVCELGRLALAENEAWLKSRRERPLTPVVG